MSNCLTFYDRQMLEYWLRTKQSLREIAVLMKRDHSVLVRELSRNGGGQQKKYRADAAQSLFERRRHKQHKGKLENKSAEETKQALSLIAESMPKELFLTITFDNGTEGSKHTEIKKEYGVDTYFCDPFASWQKGGVENANKLIRQYLPRSTDLSKLTDRDIYEIQEKLNNRPRKCLNYKSPNEIIHQVVH